MSLSFLKALSGTGLYWPHFRRPHTESPAPFAPSGPAQYPLDITPACLISVVIPTYNYAHLLHRVLDSVLQQWADDIELLVVNDGSQDATAEVLSAYVQRHGARVQVIHQHNAGAAAARNRGIAAATGRYVLPLDADDELLPGAFAVLRRTLAEQPDAAMVLGAQLSVDNNGHQRLRLPTPVSGTARQRCQRYLLDKAISISHSRALFRRDLMLQRPYPQHLRSGEDIAVFAYLLISGEVLTTPHPLARIHKHDDSLRHCRHDEEAVALGMIDEVFAHLPAHCQDLRQRYAAQRYLSVFRAAWREGDYAAAKRFYCQALRLSVWQALNPSYLGKRLRMVLH